MLIGRTGDGKSALANVISNTENFKESEYGVSETEKVQNESFEHKEIKYRVIDTPGISHTKEKLSTEIILAEIIGEVAHSIVCSNLRQVFFVTSNKFTREEIEAYDILKTIIFDDNIKDYITIVRTNFPNFMNAEKWGKDAVKTGDGRHLGSLGYCGFIYVDNPPLNIIEIDTKSVSNEQAIKIISREKGLQKSKEEALEPQGQLCTYCRNPFSDGISYHYEKTPTLSYCSDCHRIIKSHVQKMNRRMKDTNKEIREFSREKLLERLEECLIKENEGKPYKASKELKNLSEEINKWSVKILILEELKKEVEKKESRFNNSLSNKEKELLISILEELNEQLKSSVCQKIIGYIGRKDQRNKPFNIKNFDLKQLKEKWPDITTTILDNSSKIIANVAPPASWAVSGTLTIVSEIIKVCQQNKAQIQIPPK